MSGICRTRLAEERKQWRKVSSSVRELSNLRLFPLSLGSLYTPLWGTCMLMSRFRVVRLFLSRVLGVVVE